MQLQSIQFSENEGTPQEWTLEGLSLGVVNLIVGKNASGKTRTLNIISGLARNLIGIPARGFSGSYDSHFIHKSKNYTYQMAYRDQEVVSEKLMIDGKPYIDRRTGGEGTIFAEKIDGGKDIRFQTPTSQLAAVVRRDALQHSFLEPLYEWAASVRHFYFGTSFGKENLAIFVQTDAMQLDERDPNAVVQVFRQAVKEFGDKFTNALISDLKQVDYRVTKVEIGDPISLRILGAPGAVVMLNVKEIDLPGITDQNSMSQGMYRVLSLLIHLNYYQLKKTATCILIDDIGEGLDFDRSCQIIDLLRDKAMKSQVQVILTTNDRFVMNRVPLEEWSVIQRKGNHVHVRNYENSRKVFEDFKFTGLSNFSFLELDLINETPASDNKDK